MFILKKGHQPGVYVPLRALFLVSSFFSFYIFSFSVFLCIYRDFFFLVSQGPL